MPGFPAPLARALTRRRDGALSLVLAALLAAPTPALAQTPAVRRPPDGFTFAATGDLLGPWKPMTQVGDSGLEAVGRLTRGADAAFANMEGAIFDLAKFTGAPAPQNGGGTPRAEPEVANDLKVMGIDLLSMANNHATDWGLEGLALSTAVLEAAGLAHAGTGPDLSRARSPAYFHSGRGVVALVAAASTFTAMSVAADPTPGRRGRAGLSPLRVKRSVLVTPEDLAVLAKIAARDGAHAPSAGDQVTLGETSFRTGEPSGRSYGANPTDRAAIVASVAEARKSADVVVFSIHAHETASSNGEDNRPADFLPPLFHDLIDAGADVVVRHGPHSLLGVEIYKGKPIFYGMGSLFFGVGGKSRRYGGGEQASGFEMPAPWYDSAVAIAEFAGGEVRRVRIHPIVMNMEDDAVLGSPRPATGVDADRILKKLQRDSAIFGTEVRIENGVGVIDGPGRP